MIDAVEFWDIPEAFNVPNAQGYAITRVLKNGGEYRVDVVDGELMVKYKGVNAILARGYNVVGTKIEIVHQPTGKQYELYVGTVGQLQYWSRPYTYFGSPPMAWTYQLYWKFPPPPNQPPTTGGASYQVCGENVTNDGMADFTAVLFDDDQIDGARKRVLADRPNWFNIGCAGHALAKQHLTGHTKAAQARMLWPTTPRQRTANLKMITADYCGLGAPFTVAGQPLLWKDEWSYYNTTNLSGYYTKQLEARWDEYGAICLNTPRVEYRTTAEGTATFPDGVEPEMDPAEGWCTERNPRPPPCTGSYTDMQGAHTVSVNYRLLVLPQPL